MEMNEEKYTIEQIIDAIVQADEEIIHAIQYKDREMLEDVLKELSFEKWLESSYFAKKIADALLCNCSGCQSEGTDECMHCMRAYTDCYKAKKQEG